MLHAHAGNSGQREGTKENKIARVTVTVRLMCSVIKLAGARDRGPPKEGTRVPPEMTLVYRRAATISRASGMRRTNHILACART